MKTENYTSCKNLGNFKNINYQQPRIVGPSCNLPRQTAWQPSSVPFCNDDVLIDAPFSEYISPNQKLAVGHIPRVYDPLPEAVMTQSYDFCQWKDTPYISNAAVNNAGKTYLGLSGYIPESCSDESFSDWTGPQFVSSDELVTYTKNQPINANLGISETPGFAQSRFLGAPRWEPDVETQRTRIVDIDDIYDPRQTGYASNDRYYIDEITGQPRYYYNDIEGIQRPTWKRTNIDFLWNVSKDIVEESFIDRTNAYRKNLEESLMSKRNAEMWQLQQYPLRRDMGNCWHA